MEDNVSIGLKIKNNLLIDIWKCEEEEVIIPAEVTTIKRNAFKGCKSVKNITFEEGSCLTYIEKNAFYECSNLKSIVIPSSVTSIGNYALSSCKNLTNVYYMGTEDEWNNITINTDKSKLTSATITYNYNK